MQPCFRQQERSTYMGIGGRLQKRRKVPIQMREEEATANLAATSPSVAQRSRLCADQRLLAVGVSKSGLDRRPGVPVSRLCADQRLLAVGVSKSGLDRRPGVPVSSNGQAVGLVAPVSALRSPHDHSKTRPQTTPVLRYNSPQRQQHAAPIAEPRPPGQAPS